MLIVPKGFTAASGGHVGSATNMATRPTVLYPDRSTHADKRGAADASDADFVAFRSNTTEPLLPEDHLLALREGMDYLSGILLLLNEHLQQPTGATRADDSIAAVTEHALSRSRELRSHVDALTDDYLQRLRQNQR